MRLASAATSPVRRGNFDSICRSANGHDRDTATEDESAHSDLGYGTTCARDDGPDDDDPASDKHGDAATPSVRYSGGERSSDDRAYTIERSDDSDFLASQAGAKGVLERLHGNDAAHQGAVIAIGAGAAEGDENGEVHLDGTHAPSFDFGLGDGGEVFGLFPKHARGQSRSSPS